MIFTKPVSTLRKTSSIFFTRLTLFKKIIAFYSKNRKKLTNRGWEKFRDVEFEKVKQSRYRPGVAQRVLGS
jgi:hypothetical protein